MEDQTIMAGFEAYDSYTDFVERFKNKKTTDDCYTPERVYDAVADWVAAEYHVDRTRFVRPFWPGADYTREDYPDGCVVVDNPPFSILKKILEFYQRREIRFFLFAPGLTAMGTASRAGCCMIGCGCDITYANGAAINTSFVTNLEDPAARSAPDLYQAVKAANEAENPKENKQRYKYPDHVLTGAMLNYYSAHNTRYRVERGSVHRIGALDEQRTAGKSIFGEGLLLSEKAAAEKAAAEKAEAKEWGLSERERRIIAALE